MNYNKARPKESSRLRNRREDIEVLIEDHEIKERARIDRQRQDRINAANDAEKRRKEKESREKKVAETRRREEEEVYF